MTKLLVSKKMTIFVNILNSVALCKYGEIARVKYRRPTSFIYFFCIFRHLEIQVSDEKFRSLI